MRENFPIFAKDRIGDLSNIVDQYAVYYTMLNLRNILVKRTFLSSVTSIFSSSTSQYMNYVTNNMKHTYRKSDINFMLIIQIVLLLHSFLLFQRF